MKVVIIRNAYAYDFGGAERLAVNIGQELQQNNAEVTVVSRQKRLLAYARSEGVPAVRGWWWSRQNWSGAYVFLLPLYLVWQLLLFLWYIQLFLRLRPQIVHIQSKDDFIAGTFAAKLLGKKVFWTDPADLKYILANAHVWYKNPVGKLVGFASRFTSLVFLVSESELNFVKQSLGGEIPPNFAVMRIAGKQADVNAFPRDRDNQDAVIFCSTSRLVVAKGIGELVEAFAKLASGTDKYRLWIVGDGPDEAAFKKQTEGNKNIEFIGHSDTPLSYVSSADVFVLPTYNEGFSLALAEAAMLGKPMIATDVGGNPELVNSKNGILVRVRDVEGLVVAMRKLGEDADLREKLGKQAGKDYADNLDFGNIIKGKLIPFYEQALKN